MERLLTRRNLFEVLGGGATVVAAEGLVVKKAPVGEVTDEVITRIEDHSRGLIPHITSFTFEEPALSDRVLNRAVIAQSLLFLAFLDGGDTEVKQVAKFISQVGLVFQLSDFPESKTEGNMIASVDNQPITVNLYKPAMEYYALVKELNQDEDPQAVEVLDEVDQLILHELDHVVQQARDPEKFPILHNASKLVIPVAVTAPAVAIIFDVLSRGFDQRFLPSEEKNRRGFTKSILLDFTKGTVAALTTLPLFNYLYQQHDTALFEQRAELQAQRLFNNPSFAHLQGQFII